MQGTQAAGCYNSRSKSCFKWEKKKMYICIYSYSIYREQFRWEVSLSYIQITIRENILPAWHWIRTVAQARGPRAPHNPPAVQSFPDLRVQCRTWQQVLSKGIPKYGSDIYIQMLGNMHSGVLVLCNQLLASHRISIKTKKMACFFYE